MAWLNISSKVIVAPSHLHCRDAILWRDNLNTNASWKRETSAGTAYPIACGPSTPPIHLHGGGVLVRYGAIRDTRARIQTQSLIDDSKCFETVRALRWPDGVGCPTCDSPQVVIRMVANVHHTIIQPLICATIAPGTCVYPDEYDIYARLEPWGYEHKTVCQSAGDYPQDEDGDGVHEVQLRTSRFWPHAYRTVDPRGQDSCFFLDYEKSLSYEGTHVGKHWQRF